MENRVLTVEEAAAYIPALLQEDWLLPLLGTGTSMTPFLCHRRDTVYIRGIRHCTQPREGDILLFYRADNKTLILHRICRRYRDGSVLVNGDAQTWTEHVQPAQMLGIVMQISRAGGKPFSANRLDQRILRKLWKWLAGPALPVSMGCRYPKEACRYIAVGLSPGRCATARLLMLWTSQA